MEVYTGTTGDSACAGAVKRRKTRRGRKKRCKCMSSFEDQPEVCCICGRRYDQLTSKQGSNVNDIDVVNVERKVGLKMSRPRRHMLRPSSPKAPRNTTDFLIEDHLSIRQPSFSKLTFNKDIKIDAGKQWSPIGPDMEDNLVDVLPCTDEQCVPGVGLCVSGERPASKQSPADIDYQYESLESSDDTLSFLQQDFETAYSSVLEESLLSLPQEELSSSVISMQRRIAETEQLLVKSDMNITRSIKTEASSYWDVLKCELKSLMEENKFLKEENHKLKSKFL